MKWMRVMSREQDASFSPFFFELSLFICNFAARYNALHYDNRNNDKNTWLFGSYSCSELRLHMHYSAYISVAKVHFSAPG